MLIKFGLDSGLSANSGLSFRSNYMEILTTFQREWESYAIIWF